MADAMRVQVLVIGSGAGGSTTALTLAELGYEVLVLEEGSQESLRHYGGPATRAMSRLYRRRGMTPIAGRAPIGFVEGRALGGSTEINSGFWHRLPPEVALSWGAHWGLLECTPEALAPHFDWAEAELSVRRHQGPVPASTAVFANGIRAMDWSYQEVPRAAKGCQQTNACAHGCPNGAKQGMSQSLIPKAKRNGARFLTDCAVKFLITRQSRVRGALVEFRSKENSQSRLARIEADHVFVCAGPTQTPVLLRTSGIKLHVGDSLRIHPMLKVAARFPETLDAHQSVLPLVQVKEFWPEISMGGSFLTPGHLAMLLSEGSPEIAESMSAIRHMGAYYVGVRGSGLGSVRPARFGRGSAKLRYELSQEDQRHLSTGVSRLCMALLAAGAESITPGVFGMPPVTSRVQAARFLQDLIPLSALSLTTVHAFSSCPMGEQADRTAANSFGRVHGTENLYVNDASMLPSSPGVNPQGTVMALARRNALHFAESNPAR